MKLKHTLLGIVMGASLLAAPQLQSAAFLKFDGIDGEAMDANHDKWIIIESASWGIDKEPDVAGASPTAATSKPFACVKRIDKASPKLVELIATGGVNPTATVHFTRVTSAGPVVYLKYELINVRVTSYSVSGSAAGQQVPTEQISLNFEEIKVTYSEIDNTTGQSRGDVEYTWKVEPGVG